MLVFGASRAWLIGTLARLGLEHSLLRFIGVAQSAGFKLREIKQLIDGADGLGAPMRSLSSQNLSEVEVLLERTKAMKGWLEVAQQCGCATPAKCARLPEPGEEHASADLALRIVHVGAKDCRRPPAG